MILPERIQPLNSKPIAPRGKKRYVLYWMQQSQRSRCNHALEHAIDRANTLGQPVVAVFGMTDDYPEANERHYAFMLEGLAEAGAGLRERGVQLVVLHRSPEKAVLDLAHDASLIVVDRGYLRIQKHWRLHAAREAPCLVEQVESDVVVPVEVASSKEEFAARTIRPRLHRQLARFLVPLSVVKAKHDSLALKFDGLPTLDITDIDGTLAKLKIDRSVPRVRAYRGGEREADKLLTAFLQRKLREYATLRNEPSLDYVSHMSPYLHFGQVSPIDIALRAKAVGESGGAPREQVDVFLEELIVRRELSMNFVHYNADYDKYECLPAWARQTLRQHASDPRKPCYTRDELERARTHDPYWNAAQNEMVRGGKMHNYMRMYWGKKILEWTATPEEAFRIALELNNKYELDGRDANSFAGVAWVFGKHDRPWTRRPIFGTVRYMNDKGLERKCDIKAYVRKVDAMSLIRA